MPKRKPKPRTAQAEIPVKLPVAQPHGGAIHQGGVPGHRGGSGRPKEAQRAKCREALNGRDNEIDGVEYVAGVMRGTETEDITVMVGHGDKAEQIVLKVRPKTRDRLYAFELLSDRGYGKPDQVESTPERPRLMGEALNKRILEMLPRVLATLPFDRKELARILAQRQRVALMVRGHKVSPPEEPA